MGAKYDDIFFMIIVFDTYGIKVNNKYIIWKKSGWSLLSTLWNQKSLMERTDKYFCFHLIASLLRRV